MVKEIDGGGLKREKKWYLEAEKNQRSRHAKPLTIKRLGAPKEANQEDENDNGGGPKLQHLQCQKPYKPTHKYEIKNKTKQVDKTKKKGKEKTLDDCPKKNDKKKKKKGPPQKTAHGGTGTRSKELTPDEKKAGLALAPPTTWGRVQIKRPITRRGTSKAKKIKKRGGYHSRAREGRWLAVLPENSEGEEEPLKQNCRRRQTLLKM